MDPLAGILFQLLQAPYVHVAMVIGIIITTIAVWGISPSSEELESDPLYDCVVPFKLTYIRTATAVEIALAIAGIFLSIVHFIFFIVGCLVGTLPGLMVHEITVTLSKFVFNAMYTVYAVVMMILGCVFFLADGENGGSRVPLAPPPVNATLLDQSGCKNIHLDGYTVSIFYCIVIFVNPIFLVSDLLFAIAAIRTLFSEWFVG